MTSTNIRFTAIFIILHFDWSMHQTVNQTPVNKRAHNAYTIALDVCSTFFIMFQQCLNTPMSNQQFLTDDLNSFVNYPMKTTVGLSPKYTNHRKFLANLMNTPAFKDMLAKDIKDMRTGIYKKMKYCDEVVLDQNILRDFYDREIDQAKM